MLSVEPFFELLQQSATSLSVGYLHSVVPKLAAHYQIDQAVLLEQAGITNAEWQHTNCLLPFYKVAALFFHLWQTEQDPAFGLRIGAATDIRSFQLLGYVLMSCDTLADAMSCLQRYEKLVGQLGSTQVHVGTDDVIIEWNNPLAGEWSGFISDAAIAGWVGVARSLTGIDLAPKQVYLKHEAPQNEQLFQSYFNCPVQFNAALDGVQVTLAQLTATITTRDSLLRDIIQREADVRLEKFDGHWNLINAVRAEIWKTLSAGEPRIDRVADALALTPRNLQQRLKTADAHFAALVDEVRHAAALRYLRNASLPLAEIAFLLGFAEQSSFNRAFKRWTTLSPSEWRERTR